MCECALPNFFFMQISTGIETSLGLVIGLLIAFLMILTGAVVVTICLAIVIVRKRKATIRSLQLEVLTRSVIV